MTTSTSKNMEQKKQNNKYEYMIVINPISITVDNLKTEVNTIMNSL